MRSRSCLHASRDACAWTCIDGRLVSLLRRHVRAMPVAQHARRFPTLIAQTPDDDEIGDALALAAVELAERVLALFDRTEVLDGIHAQAARHQLAPEMAADVLPGVRDHRLARPGDTTLVVVELELGREVTGVFVQLARL